MFGVKYCQINLYQLLDELVMTLMHEGWKGYKPFPAIFRSVRSVDGIIIPITRGYNKLNFELSKEYNFMWVWGFSQKNFTKRIKSCPWNLKMLDFFDAHITYWLLCDFQNEILTFIKWNGEKYKSFSSRRSIRLLDVVCFLSTIFLLSSYLTIVKIDPHVIDWKIVLNFQTLQKTRFCNLKLIVPWLFDPVSYQISMEGLQSTLSAMLWSFTYNDTVMPTLKPCFSMYKGYACCLTCLNNVYHNIVYVNSWRICMWGFFSVKNVLVKSFTLRGARSP
jgi:hypothetical protein